MKSKTPVSDKKLKQARLPFKTINPRSPGAEKVSVAKKRKLSNSSQDVRAVIKKVFVKENIDSSLGAHVISDNETDDEVNDPKNKSVKKNLNPTVNLVDNVQKLLEEYQTNSTLNESDSVDESSVSSKTNSVISIKDGEELTEVAYEELEFEIKTPQKCVPSTSQAEEEIESTNKIDCIDDSINNQSSKTPTQIKKTPKQLQKQKESAKKKEERERARLEREKLRQNEKELRLRQRQEQDEQRRREKEERDEQRRKDKEEKEDQRKREKEEKEKKRLAEIELKNEERRLKEEDRKRKEELKEEEKRKKELQREEKLRREKLEKEEAEHKQKKAAEAFVNFFVPKKVVEDQIPESFTITDDKVLENEKKTFMPFSLKADMRLAPAVRRLMDSESKIRFESMLTSEMLKNKLYLQTIKDPAYIFGKSSKTWQYSEKDLFIVDDEGEPIVESNTINRHSRPKLLQFHENRRPPYWGTWTKRSYSIGPRTPFGKDKILDYEVDSDSEWEEEEPGESLHGSDDEKEKDGSDDDYEVDNDFFVPHGYLSDEEQNNAEEIDDISPENMKVKLKILQNEFNEEMKKKTEKILPRLYGCVWANEDGSKPEKCMDTLWSMLNEYAMIYDSPILLQPVDNNSSSSSDATLGPGSKLTKLSEVLVPDLIKLIHGNKNRKSFLIKEFYAYAKKKFEEHGKNLSKSAINRKIYEIAKYTSIQEDSGSTIRCWFVVQSCRDAYGLSKLPLINTWVYVLKRKLIEKDSCDNQSTVIDKKKIASHPNHSKFTKVCSNDDNVKQSNNSKIPVQREQKKRVSLISVPMGSKFPTITDSQPISNNPKTGPEKSVDLDTSVFNAPCKNIEKSKKSKTKVNLLSSFIKRTEHKYSANAFANTQTSATNMTDATNSDNALKQNAKNEINDNSQIDEGMDVDDCILLSD